ncbi:AAA family ATPase [Oceanisphaera psychrotolerans]|uniref:ATPase AAA-type core domain-containing protein n=1 Tax=Oceanisphaera psychrotolerans TaxID=1414654 RepID=A0A1J4QGK9_9GAMM|nr:ATP-binding protein [Oceanisphaera psychrotolerans]OIN11149.1 hypothetical protein BFR47_12465 [Oceanisphaera psychrotolerans]
MTATNSKQDEEYNLFEPEGLREKVLPIVAIYGANGAGKTNVIAALMFFVHTILHNHRRDFSEINFPKFKLDPSFEKSESEFDIDFMFEGVHYNYGYIVNDGVVRSEWLYSFSYKQRASRTVLFHRDVESEDGEYYFNKVLKGKNKSISDVTSRSSLFLSTAAKSNHDLINRIYDYFKSSYNFRFRNDVQENAIAKKIKDNNLTKDIGSFLSLIDIGAVEMNVGIYEVDDEQKEIKASFKQALMSVLNSKENVDFKFPDDDSNIEYKISISRRNSNDKLVKFKYGDESLGTKSLISLLASVFLILREGGIFVVDELESSLHTLLSLKVVELFNCSRINSKGAQLIFTTHETQLLNYKGFRKDEVWLAEKCENGSTKIAPLSDYSIPNKSNVRNGYLDGRFGAVPFLGLMNNFEKLWSE